MLPTAATKAKPKTKPKAVPVRDTAADVVQVRLTAAESERYRAAAREQGLTLSSLIRVSVNTYLRSVGM